MSNKLKIKLCKWRFERYVKLRNKALSDARKHCINGDDCKFDKSMDKASYYMRKIVKITKEVDELIEIEQLRAWFWY